MEVAPAEFDRDTAVTQVDHGQFEADISDRWNTFVGPDGGYVMALAVRALQETLPFPDPLVTSGHFLRPAAVGGVTITTEAVKVGRRHATATARVSQAGRDLLVVVGTFADLTGATGRTEMIARPPDLPDPIDCIDPLASMPDVGASIVHRVAYRLAELPGWMRGEPSGRPAAEFWMRLQDGRPPDPLALTFLVDAAPPTVLEIGETASSTVELTTHVRARPAEGWLACRLATKHVMNGYHEEDMEIWDSAGTLVAQSRQLALLL